MNYEALSVKGLHLHTAAIFEILFGGCSVVAEGCSALAMLACVVRPPCVDVEDVKAKLMPRYLVLDHAELRCFDGTALFCASSALKRGFVCSDRVVLVTQTTEVVTARLCLNMASPGTQHSSLLKFCSSEQRLNERSGKQGPVLQLPRKRSKTP